MAANLDEIDPDFVDDLHASAPSLFAAAAWIRNKHKLPVIVRPTFVRDHPDNRALYADAGDLEIIRRAEVKHRTIQFGSLEEFPYPTVIVDVAHSWDRAPSKPVVYIICNADLSGAILVDPKKTSGQWVQTTKMDKKRGRVRNYYECPKGLCTYVSFQ